MNKLKKKYTFEIATQIRQDYLNGIKFSELKIKYDIHERVLCNILNNSRHFDPSYKKPEGKRTNKSSAEIFISRAQKIHIDENGQTLYDYSNVVYKRAIVKVDIWCKFHNKFFSQSPDSHLRGNGCNDCGNIKIGNSLRHSNEDLDQYLIDHNIPIKRIGNYKNSDDPLEFECLNCKYRWKTATCHIKDKNDGTRCPRCHKKNIFKNEYLIGSFLDNIGLKYEPLTIKTNNKRMYPDYFIPSLNMIIEYNGQQHYSPVCFGNMSFAAAEKEFKEQQIRDEMMRNYCKNNNINLLEIDGRKYRGEKLLSFLNITFEHLILKKAI